MSPTLGRCLANSAVDVLYERDPVCRCEHLLIPKICLRGVGVLLQAQAGDAITAEQL
jgi:hypothetical protein